VTLATTANNSYSGAMITTLSIGKILVVLFVVAIAFFLMRSASKASDKRRSSAAPKGNPRTVELAACPRCGTFLPKGSWCTCDRK
jgi:hypothetical protein